MEASSPGDAHLPAPAELVERARALLREGSPPGLGELGDIAALLVSEDPAEAVVAARVAGLAAASEDPALSAAGRELLRRTAISGPAPAARRSIQCLASAKDPEGFRTTLERSLEANPKLLDDETVAILAGQSMGRATVEAFVGLAGELLLRQEGSPAAEGLVRFIVAFGATHPSWYRRLRYLLTRGSIMGGSPQLRETARSAREELESAFRRWLGPVAHIAVSQETGEEYGWDDVVTFAEGVPERDRHRLLVAIKHSPLIREAVLLLHGGTTLELGHVLPGGICIQRIGEGHGRSVYRVTIQVRGGGRHELALKLAPEQTAESLRGETDWMILCGDGDTAPVVARFGGHWPDLHLWTEELIPGENLAATLERLSVRRDGPERFTGFWPYAAWSAMAAFVSFWKQTGRRLMVADPGPENAFVPLHDYHAPARLLSIAHRVRCDSPAPLLHALRTHLVEATEALHPRLEGLVSWDAVFSAFLEAMGERAGLELLEAVLGELGETVAPLLERYVEAVRRRGFLPLRLYFAIKRYERWARLNPGATPEARAQTLHDLYSTYDLTVLQPSHPETRVRFFRETVLPDVSGELVEGLDRLIQELRIGSVRPSDLGNAVAALRARAETCDPEADFFLARLSLPHLKPADTAGFAMAPEGGTATSDVVVTVRDADGSFFSIRHALRQREVEALHRLFLDEMLPVDFHHRHRFLVAVADDGRVAGGLFYELDATKRAAHMDKVVVAYRFRGKGLAAALMDELANRLRAMDIITLTTGFFRPQFFYRHGFRIEPHHAGLVRDLRTDGPASPE